MDRRGFLIAGAALVSGCGGGSDASAGVSGAVISSAGGPPNSPGAPAIVLIKPSILGATIWFQPPASDGGAQITKYTATASPGGAQGVSTIISSVNAVSCRIDVSGLSPNQSYTFTVSATNSNGTGPESPPSAPVTPDAYADYWVTHGYASGLRASPAWYDYDAGSGSVTWAAAPPNPPAAPSGSTVSILRGTATQFIIQPYVGHTYPDGTTVGQQGNGRISMSPFKYLTLKVWPTQSNVFFDSWFERELFINGVATGGGTGTLVDARQNWTPNVFTQSGFVIWNITRKQWITGISGNTATSITFTDGVAFAPGDLYEIGLSDQGIGKQISDITANAWCVNSPMLPNQWNTCNIPLSAYDTPGQTDVSQANILKFALRDQGTTAPTLIYFADIGFVQSPQP